LNESLPEKIEKTANKETEKSEIEEMLNDETLTDEDRETLLLMLSELEGV